jgi:catechol 2,3-dioxygenase-like lactoylglutathione lyase family enzyme
MIDHTGIKVRDIARSGSFYRAALAPLGYRLLLEFPAEVTGTDHVAGFGEGERCDFWIAQGEPNRPPLHVAFRVAERSLVDRFHAAALAAGGRDNGPPGPRPYYHADYYGAFVLDPDGHNIEVVCHEPAAAPPGRPAAG